MLIVTCLVCNGCGAAEEKSSDSASGQVTISNFKAGLVCGLEENDRRVCFETNSIQITGESLCEFTGGSRPCTWYGYSFDYELPADSVKMKCTFKADHSADIGSSTSAIKTDRDEFEIPLTGHRGHFFNPQFSILPKPQNGKGAVKHVHNLCTYGGRKVFEVTFELRYPER